jgi:hypothetical protein
MFIDSHNAKLEWVRDELCFQFVMSILGLFALYLGVDFFYTTLGVFFSHHWYILKCLFNFGLDHCIPSLV